MSASHRHPRSPIRALLRLAAGGALLAAPLAARAQDGVRVQPPYAPTAPQPFEALSESALTLGDSIVALAREQLGRRYVPGGDSPGRGFDCSGLVRYIASALHIPVPRTARQQARVGEAVPRDTADLRPGDLVTFGRGARISHIGIYVGDGRFIHASTVAGRVIETWLLRPWAAGIKKWRGARRLAMADSTASADQ